MKPFKAATVTLVAVRLEPVMVNEIEMDGYQASILKSKNLLILETPVENFEFLGRDLFLVLTLNGMLGGTILLRVNVCMFYVQEIMIFEMKDCDDVHSSVPKDLKIRLDFKLGDNPAYELEWRNKCNEIVKQYQTIDGILKEEFQTHVFLCGNETKEIEEIKLKDGGSKKDI